MWWRYGSGMGEERQDVAANVVANRRPDFLPRKHTAGTDKGKAILVTKNTTAKDTKVGRRHVGLRCANLICGNGIGRIASQNRSDAPRLAPSERAGIEKGWRQPLSPSTARKHQIQQTSAFQPL
ncbi:hypothetical protein GCM10011419_07820 [Vogesella fluminis]|uniref:Uncharacterized protein n=1 Tax=Vogesella fluminis TaxID=1069161 RepID=A0ABQ3HA14_9NEIS|nr:hypothetical protein GCM10011419_07820 [Vogesella fluminis]